MTYSTQGIREEEQASQELAPLLETALLAWLTYLATLLDKGLLSTLVQWWLALRALAQEQTRPALGVNWARFWMALMASAKRPRARSKRVAHLIGSLKGTAGHSDRFLLAEAQQEVERLKGLGKRIVALMDGRVSEKPQSGSPQALGPASASQSQTAQSLAPRLALPSAAVAAHPGDENGMERNQHDRMAR
jgi:hypothetical protein